MYRSVRIRREFIVLDRELHLNERQIKKGVNAYSLSQFRNLEYMYVLFVNTWLWNNLKLQHQH